MAFWLYILRCADGTYYTGHTDDLERRIAEHQTGAMPGYTDDRRPVEVMFAETFQTREEALNRERQIKDWSRKKKEALFRGDWATVARAAASRPRVSTALDARSKRTAKEGTAAGFEPVENPPGAAAKSTRTDPINDTVWFEPVENWPGTAVPPGPRQRAATPPPVIVLVRPQLAENIGKAARAMLNFGLTELRLVGPRDGWPNPDAGPAASGADAVLAGAVVFASVAEAVADCAHVYATTVRKRGVTKPVVTPEAAAQAMRAAPGRSAILFGPERSGLETDDVALARTILTVPINPAFGSLNLAQAVILCAYEWSKHGPSGAEGDEPLAQPPATALDPPAPQEELEGLIAHLERMLDAANHYFPPDRAPAARRTLRGVLTKPAWTAQEVRTLRGVLSSLERPRRR